MLVLLLERGGIGLGLVGIGAGFIGYLNGPVNPLMRLVSLAGGLCLVIPGTLTDIIGIALVAVVYVTNRLSHKKSVAAAGADKK